MLLSHKCKPHLNYSSLRIRKLWQILLKTGLCKNRWATLKNWRQSKQDSWWKRLLIQIFSKMINIQSLCIKWQLIAYKTNYPSRSSMTHSNSWIKLTLEQCCRKLVKQRIKFCSKERCRMRWLKVLTNHPTCLWIPSWPPSLSRLPTSQTAPTSWQTQRRATRSD